MKLRGYKSNYLRLILDQRADEIPWDNLPPDELLVLLIYAGACMGPDGIPPKCLTYELLTAKTEDGVSLLLALAHPAAMAKIPESVLSRLTVEDLSWRTYPSAYSALDELVENGAWRSLPRNVIAACNQVEVEVGSRRVKFGDFVAAREASAPKPTRSYS